ncbi:MAG: phosphoribosylglycinamide formyltransferase [Candidatus Zixiibacteriota bacterium]|nr:MAG: phosphoribosylglycinamide formyltransferase [candidate division Zixibacteria bacterium]
MDIMKPKVAVFISGGGSNLQALIDATKANILSAEIGLVVSNKSKAFGLTRAKNENIKTFIFKSKKYLSPEDAGDKLLEILKENNIEYIALSGYLRLLPKQVIENYPKKIINIHPALLPKYGGKGMYGHFVHEAVIKNKEIESGVTVHLADEIYDNGKILAQVKVPVMTEDTPESLAERVLKQEHRLFPRVLQKLIKGEYNIE